MIRAEVAEVLAPKPRTVEQRIADLEMATIRSERAITYDDLYEIGYYALGIFGFLVLIALLNRNRF